MPEHAAAREPVDALFFSYYADVDRWHNDWADEVQRAPERAGPSGKLDQTMMGRIERQSVRIDGRMVERASPLRRPMIRGLTVLGMGVLRVEVGLNSTYRTS